MSKEGVTRVDRWIYGSPDVTLENQEATAKQKKIANIYGEAIVAAGRAEWDIKLEFEGFGGIVVGLWRHNLAEKNNLEQLPVENEQFVNFESGCGFANKTGEFIENKERKSYSETPWKRGSVLTLHLDLMSQTLTYSVDGKPVGLAKDGLPRGAYRLAAKLQFQEQKLNILRFWSSLEDNGVIQIPNAISSKKETETEKEKEKETEKEANNNKESDTAIEIASDIVEQKNWTDSNSKDQVDTNKKVDSDVSQITAEHVSNTDNSLNTNTNTNINTNNNNISDNLQSLDLTQLQNQDPPTDSPDKKSKHGRSYSLTEMRDQIRQQKRNSGSWKDNEELLPSPANEDPAVAPLLNRARSGSGSTPVAAINIPDRVEIEEKDDDSTDTFVVAGNNLSCDVDVVTCTKEAKGVRNSAFGAQVVTHGRMDWMLEVEKGHSIRIGVSGVTHTGEDFTDSKFGYGYGDDGNIYCHRSLIEWGDGYKSGDVVGVHLDMEKHTLRFSVNGHDHGIAFEKLQTQEDGGVDGYRLAVSLQYRPHQVKLVESTLYNTKQYSPRPNNYGNGSHPRNASWFQRGNTAEDLKISPNDEKTEGDKSDEATTPQPTTEEEEKENPKEQNNAEATANAKSPNGNNNTKTQTPTRNGGPKTASGKGTTKEPTDKGKDKTDGTNATRNGIKTSTQNGSGTRKSNTGSKSMPPKNGNVRPVRATSALTPKVNGALKPKPAKPSAPTKTTNSEEHVKWKAPRDAEDQFEYSGTQLRIDTSSCLAKNNIQDGNSAFGSLEVTKDMKVEWTLKVMQGAQVVIGVMQTDESLKKNSTKYRKLLNNIFCTDRSGYGYFGKDGGVMKGGKYRKYGAPYKSGDTITVVLDMVTNQLQFGKDSKLQGVAFSNIPTGCYRLAVMLPKKMHKVIIEKVQVWELDK